jgi:phospholipid-translocating ATPase
LKDFAGQGLRTLVFGSKMISEEELFVWKDKYNPIRSSSSDNKEQELNKLDLQMESGIIFRGIAGIEDKLQEGVPETIELFLKANINFWVLTGDKKVIKI